MAFANGNVEDDIEEGEIADDGSNCFEENFPMSQDQQQQQPSDSSSCDPSFDPVTVRASGKENHDQLQNQKQQQQHLEEGVGGAPWKRDCLTPFGGSASYGPATTLQNLAWAKGVQCKAKDEAATAAFRTGAAGVERSLKSNVRSNSKPLALSNNPVTSAVSVPVQSTDEIKPNNNKRDNDEKCESRLEGGACESSEMEEGELEEGEIDVNLSSLSNSSGSSASNSSGSPPLGSEVSDRQAGGNTYSSRTRVDRHSDRGKDSRYRKVRSSDDVRGRDPKRRQKDDDVKKLSNERIREKKIAEVSDMVKNVKVKDAQKSFVGVCNRLNDAVSKLLDINPSIHSDNVVSVIKQIFSGIQAAFAVRNTATGLQQQEQDKHAFPRLLQLVINQGRRLFTPKQMKELERMLNSVMSGFRIFKVDASEEGKGEESGYTNTGSFRKDEEIERLSMIRESRNGIPKVSISTTTEQLSVVDSRTPKLNHYSCKPMDLCLNGRLSTSSAYNSNEMPGVTSWQSLKDPNNISQIHISSNSTETSAFNSKQQNLKYMALGGQAMDSSRSINEDKSRRMWQTDAVTYYQKFNKRAICNYDRLPSPTPSEGEDDDDSSVQGKEAFMKNDTEESQHNFHEFSSFAPNFKPQLLETKVHNVLQLEESVRTSNQAMPTNLIAGYAQKNQAKSRDPRLRVDNLVSDGVGPMNPHSLDDLTITTESMSKYTNENQNVKVEMPHEPGYPCVLPGQADTQNRYSIITSGSGGWLEESTIIPSFDDWEKPLEVEIDNTSKFSDMIEDCGSPSKRQKLDQTKCSVPCVFEDVSKCLHPNIQSTDRGVQLVNYQNKVETSDTNSNEATENMDTDPDLNIFPSVLKDIAVNPTILMQLFKQQQDRLTSQSSQINEQVQQDPSVAFLTLRMGAKFNYTMNVQQNFANNSGVQQCQHSSNAVTQTALEAAEARKQRMKARDPRRRLRMNLEKNEQLSASVVSRNMNLTPIVSRNISSALAQRVSQNSTNIEFERDVKDKLSTIYGILRKPEINASQNFENQHCISEVNKSGDLIEDSVKGSELNVADNNQYLPVFGDISPPSLSLVEEAIQVSRNQVNPWGDVDYLLKDLSEEQRMSIQQERARRIEEQNKMFSNRKLCLVLDLDHTLLNSAKFSEIDPVHEEILRKKEELDKERPERQLFRFSHMGMWTKLRPGIWNFLDKASKLYELHVYTMGNKVYATEMAKVLDPTGTLFAGRVISKGDEGDEVDGIPKSKDLDGVLGMESAVVIIDDSVRVWPHHRQNLIVVERYMYFPCSRRQFGLQGLSLLELDIDERPENGTLASSLQVIERIHQNFFASKMLHEVDVRDFLAEEQRRILRGCKIVFSRVFPVGEAQPHLHPLWQMAEQFGAVCTTQLDDQVTHVVALAPGTDKVNWAVTNGRHVVYPGWLEASALLYRRADERDFNISMNHFPLPPH